MILMRINWLNIFYSFITVAQFGSLNIYIFWNHIHFLLNFFQTGLAHWLNLNPIYFFWFFIFSTSLQSSNSDLQSLIIPSKQNPQAASESDLHTEAMWDSLPVDIIPLVLIRLPVKSIITCPSVYKTWKSIVQNPTFVYNHLHYSNNNQDLNEQTRFDFPFNNEMFRVLVTFFMTPGTKPLIHDPTHQNRVSGNPRELLVGIELKLAESTTHLKHTFMIPEEFLFRVVGTCKL